LITTNSNCLLATRANIFSHRDQHVIPFICMAPSPAVAITERWGTQTGATRKAGEAHRGECSETDCHHPRPDFQVARPPTRCGSRISAQDAMSGKREDIPRTLAAD